MLSVFLCFCPQTYSQLAHPIQQARALGLLFQSKILDIDNIDVSVFVTCQRLINQLLQEVIITRFLKSK